MRCSHALTHKNVGRDVGRYIGYDGMDGWYTGKGGLQCRCRMIIEYDGMVGWFTWYYTGDYGYKSFGLDYGYKNTTPN